ncbi:MAG: GreA/GreB family elongation factor [bacterium]|nr:GreA/GreB family elongation factor [bacterium]
MTENKYYLTKEGLEKIEKDYESLLELRKTKTTDDVPSIWHSEDVNPEYLSFQEDMNVLEARLTEYEDILKNVELISLPPKEKRTTVCLGATVTVDMGEEVDTFTIVGTLEADPSQKKISDASPLGKGLLGTKEGDFVKVTAFVANHDCKILKVRYV